MEPAGLPKGAWQASEPRTLGDVIYAKQTPAHMPETDWVSLVRSIATGDQIALHAIYERTHRIVFTLIARITHDRETAEELTLDVFDDVWRRASGYDPRKGSVVGWIMNQARSRAMDRLRFEQRNRRVNREADHARTATAAEGPHSSSQIEEQNRLLRQALDILTPEERHAIETAFFSELTYREVAARLNQPVGTVKSHMRSGLNKLRGALAGALKGK